jgi:hypothetical protein
MPIMYSVATTPLLDLRTLVGRILPDLSDGGTKGDRASARSGPTFVPWLAWRVCDC